MRNFKKKSIGVAVVATVQLMPIVANAALEEVIVTANKRAESANEIGLSISAVSGYKLKEQKLSSLEEITSAIPGLVFATSQQNTPVLTLRGVGFNESSLGVYPATSLYVDEVPLPFPVMAAHSSYDLERVEVLKGPQGVLFGQNSTGGAINFIAAKPTEELSYGGDFSYGRFNKLEANAFVSAGLSESIAARLAIQNVTSGNWQKSLTSNDENGEEDYTAARLSFRFEPSDSVEVNLNVNGWRDKSDPQALQFIAATPKKLTAPALPNANLQNTVPFTKEDARSADWSALDRPKGDKEFMQLSLRGDFGLTENVTLTVLAAYSDYEQNQALDGDGHSLVTAGFIHNKGEIDSTFAEIRLAGDGDSFQWVLGVNYEDSGTSEDQLLDLRDNTSSRADTLFIHRTGAILNQNIESLAVFGNIDLDVTEDLTLKLGARYTDTSINASSCNYAPENSPGIGNSGESITANLFNFIGGFSSVAFTPVGVDDCFSLNGPPTVGVPGFAFIDELAEDNISWRVGLDYQLSENTLLYANLSQGYKVGSYPTLAAFDFSQLQPVAEESVLAYELGIKLSLADNSIQWNGAIFHYDYEDKQVRGKAQLPIFGALDRLVNIPESTITGIETDIIAQLTEALTLTASVTYLNSEVDEYPKTLNGVGFAFDAYGVNRDLSGEDLPFTPELTYSLDLDYRTELSQGGTLFMGVNIVGQSDSDAVFDGNDLSITDAPNYDPAYYRSITENYFVVESYSTIGARVGYESEDDRVRVMFWGKNLTDEYYWNSVVTSSEGAARVAGHPRTYGLTVGYQF